MVNLDQFCEVVLLNTECSDSLLNLILTVYECSQDINFIGQIKKIDTILIQSVSLVNRLMFIPDEIKNEYDQKKNCINQSLLYFLLIKSICQQSQSGSSNIPLLNEKDPQSNDIINKNNQFLLQLNLLMSQSNPFLNKNLVNSSITENKNDTNWFHLLTKIFIYKSNQTIDCLLFSIFKTISQLTPRLFGSLIGQQTHQMHLKIIERIRTQQSGSLIATLCEFLCSLIQYQPGFFQILADVKTDSKDKDQIVEGNQSILRELFLLLSRIKSSDNENREFYETLASILSVFFTIWSVKKINLMNYCRQKSEFWSTLISSLDIIKNIETEIKSKPEINEPYLFTDYQKYFDTKFLTSSICNSPEFEEFFLNQNIKIVSFVFKIFSYELFELIYQK